MKRRAVFLVLLSCVAVLCIMHGRGAVAQQPAAESCVTDKCHTKMGKDKFVHGPVAVGDCRSCHIPTAAHKFAPMPKTAELCYKCHEKVDTKKDVHKPVKDGNCGQCHDPHQSSYKYQLRAEGVNLCFACHDKKIAAGKFVHGPVAVGGCTACHNAHQAEFPMMLNGAGNDACFGCHADKAEAFKGKKFVHKPVREKCVSCHSPHAGPYRFILTAEASQDLCYGCHADKKEWIAKVTVKHGGLDTEKKCLACHDPHVSDYVKQLVREPVDSCNMCHDKPLDTQDGPIVSMKEFLAKNKEFHGPILEGDCSGCHNTHGSDNFRMLRQYFPPLFYASFDPKNYDLCFSCHEKSIVLDPKTETLTGFRNGDQNLHFVHVNKTVKGRTCRACHDAHATNNPKHIRDKVPFGAWGLPVGFQKTADGGSCLPGCHQKFDYGRTKPLKNR